MKINAIVLDLDDTIFRTRSINPKAVEPFFRHLESNLFPIFDTCTISNILNELWQQTWDKVIDKYVIPYDVMMQSIRFLDNMEMQFDISPYPDYEFIRTLPCRKFLVTTSLTSIQQKKIKALQIENDFTKIVINDIFKEPGTKLDIFRKLISEFDLIPEQTLVIGDNADSEISAGNQLNMFTIQILRDGVLKGNNAKRFISSFYELEDIFKTHDPASK